MIMRRMTQLSIEHSEPPELNTCSPCPSRKERAGEEGVCAKKNDQNKLESIYHVKNHSLSNDPLKRSLVFFNVGSNA